MGEVIRFPVERASKSSRQESIVGEMMQSKEVIVRVGHYLSTLGREGEPEFSEYSGPEAIIVPSSVKCVDERVGTCVYTSYKGNGLVRVHDGMAFALQDIGLPEEGIFYAAAIYGGMLEALRYRMTLIGSKSTEVAEQIGNTSDGRIWGAYSPLKSGAARLAAHFSCAAVMTNVERNAGVPASSPEFLKAFFDPVSTNRDDLLY